MFSDPAGGCVDAVGWGGVGGKDKFGASDFGVGKNTGFSEGRG
jgi:hypothetical protein